MEKFKFNVNQKVKLWEKIPVEIEAENQEKAMEKLQEMLKNNQDISHLASGESELLRSTKEKILPEKNDKAPNAKTSFYKPVKKEFEFYVDEKVTIWTRNRIIVKAYSYEDAERILLDAAKENKNYVFDMAYGRTEYLYDTEEYMTPEENHHCATFEIYKENDTTESGLIYSNKQ